MAGIQDWWKTLGSMGQFSAIGAGVGTAMNLAKGIVGAVQYGKGQKELKNLLANPVTYKRPEEYYADLQAQQQRASQTRMPGQGYLEQNIGQAQATALGASERGAISSNTYQKSVGDIFSKTMDAYQNLGFQSAQWQDQQQQNLSAARQRGAQYSDMEWQQNSLAPWEMKANMAQSKMQAGGENLWGGFGGAAGNVMDFAGTSYAQQIMKNLMGGGGGNSPAIGNQSNPVQSLPPYSSRGNLNNTLADMLKRIKVNYPNT